MTDLPHWALFLTAGMNVVSAANALYAKHRYRRLMRRSLGRYSDPPYDGPRLKPGDVVLNGTALVVGVNTALTVITQGQKKGAWDHITMVVDHKVADTMVDYQQVASTEEEGEVLVCDESNGNPIALIARRVAR